MRAADIPRRGGVRAYERALRTLDEESAEWFVSHLDEGVAEATPESLAKFIDDDLLPFFRQLIVEVQSHEASRRKPWAKGCKRTAWRSSIAMKPPSIASSSAPWPCF